MPQLYTLCCASGQAEKGDTNRAIPFEFYCSRNGVSTEESIYEITCHGKGRMPGFGEKCTPRGQCTFGPRLQDDEIKLLAMFVKLQAEQGWPNIEIYKY
ncbi:Cytochrome c6 [Nymphaea thermarum]|nr:Cytochrome c6 [Nymphaea thermarum]